MLFITQLHCIKTIEPKIEYVAIQEYVFLLYI